MDEGTGRDQRRVTVTGVGRVTMTADAVVVRLGAEVTATTPGEALTACADAERQMVAALTGAGADPAAVTTHRAIVRPDWEQYGSSRPRLRGYTARLDVGVVVTEPAAAGAVALAALDAGGDVARLHGLAPVVRDRAPGEATARHRAYADARARAEQYAALAGQRVGRLLALTEADHETYHHGRYELVTMAGGEPPDVRAGEHEVAVAVTATWELAD